MPIISIFGNRCHSIDLSHSDQEAGKYHHTNTLRVTGGSPFFCYSPEGQSLT